MEEYKKAYQQLNSEQKRAVDQIDGPVLVVAGPGTGKTQLLSLRVANILRQTDTDASSILCLTFTQKAAINMRERLNQLLGSASRYVVVRTFHSFAAEIMNEYPDYFWAGARLSVAPEAVQDDIIQSILALQPLDSPLSSTFAGSFTALGDVKRSLRLAKEAGLTPDELQQVVAANLSYIDSIEPTIIDVLSPPLSLKKLTDLQAAIAKLPPQSSSDSHLLVPLDQLIQDSLDQAIMLDQDSGKTTHTSKWKRRWLQTVAGQKGMFSERRYNEWWQAVAGAYEAYREQLHARGYYDYADMLIEVLEQLQKEPEMLADIQERYLYVLIDEFQDTNAAQLRLAHLVADHYAANNRPNLMAVGDDDQSIFAFNGAELNNILSFQRSYPDTKVIVLRANYRSTQPILDYAHEVIEQAEDRLVIRDPNLKKELVAKAEQSKGTKIEHLRYPTQPHQYTALAETIHALWKDKERDIAVLARRHDSLQQLASVLLKKGIPVRYDQQSNILEHDAVRQVCQIAQIATAIAGGDKDAVNVGIAELVRHPMWQFSPKQLWKLATANYSSPDWLSSLLDSDDQKLHQLGQWLSWLARASSNQPLPLTIEYILGLREGQYLLSPLRHYYLSRQPLTSEYLETLSAISILRNLVSEYSARGPSLQDFVRFVELNLSTHTVIADESWFTSGQQAVQLLTVYKAKGLEFDHVYVVDAVESEWKPRTRGRGSPANLRLQPYGEKYDDYIRLLYVAASRARRMFTTTSYMSDDKGSEVLPTPLLANIPSTTITAPAETPTKVLEEALGWPRLSSTDERALLSERLESYSLSPSALINFLDIENAGPQTFFERSILRLPSARSVQGSFGVAIHAALETAQRLLNNGKVEFGTVLDRFEATLEREHLLPHERQQLQLKGEQLLVKLIKNAALPMQKGSLTEQHITDVTLDKARVSGKLDLIYADRHSVIITDYKTGKPLPSFETKNQALLTKAWRHKLQLLFYALLARESTRFKANDITPQMVYVEAEHRQQLVLACQPSSDELTDLEQLIKVVWHKIINLDMPDTSRYKKDHSGIVLFEKDLKEGKI